MLTMVHHILCERTEEAELGVRRLSVNTEIRTKEKRAINHSHVSAERRLCVSVTKHQSFLMKMR